MVDKNSPAAGKRPDDSCPQCGCTPRENRPGDAGRIASALEGTLSTPAGDVPRVTTRLKFKDRLGSGKVRCGIGRGAYRLPPGLYAVGHPESVSPVLVTANYKLSFDSLRKELTGLDAWVLVLDTKGINVWCAAGKGTFGTAELVGRVDEVKLDRVVSHRKIILPQLGAPGVAAHEVQKQAGFRVVYGPVRAKDLRVFLETGLKATPEMRRVKFGLAERLLIVPEEIVAAIPILLAGLALQAVIGLITAGRLSPLEFGPWVGAVLAGCALVPLLLPWIPGRSFAFKGWLAGVLWVLAFQAFCAWGLRRDFHWGSLFSSLLLLPAISAYVAMNFTGSSTFTSLSGVVKEMRRAVPLMIGAASLGVILVVVRFFVKF
jgi:hypothetical protein